MLSTSGMLMQRKWPLENPKGRISQARDNKSAMRLANMLSFEICHDNP
jgi:hypothetical protein|tara:strand:+ start:555 stop:698 length:144 start_codon:yes stop_codon:yes gene_type:complete